VSDPKEKNGPTSFSFVAGFRWLVGWLMIFFTGRLKLAGSERNPFLLYSEKFSKKPHMYLSMRFSSFSERKNLELVLV
jgi:hypothetical protein